MMPSLVLLTSIFFAAMLLMTTVVRGEEVIIDFRAGPHKLAVFYQGDQEDPDLDVEVEKFLGFVKPKGHFTQTMFTGQAFIVRSVNDFDFVAKVVVWDNPGDTDRPYVVTLKNLQMDDAVEVKLSDEGGYTWIDAGAYTNQFTDVQHDLEFLDAKGKTTLAVRLFPAAKEL